VNTGNLCNGLGEIPEENLEESILRRIEEGLKRNLRGVSTRISRTLLRVVQENFEQRLQRKHVKYFEKFLKKILLYYFKKLKMK